MAHVGQHLGPPVALPLRGPVATVIAQLAQLSGGRVEGGELRAVEG